jgi:hypothetical protein
MSHKKSRLNEAAFPFIVEASIQLLQSLGFLFFFL